MEKQYNTLPALARPFVTVKEAAAILGRPARYVYEIAAARKIRSYKPNGGRLLFDRRDVEAFRRDCLHNKGRIYEPHTVTIEFYRMTGRRGV